MYSRWWFCPWFAIIFPSLSGMELPFELEFFYLEHYLAAFVAPVLLMLSGRYGFFFYDKNVFKLIWNWLAH